MPEDEELIHHQIDHNLILAWSEKLRSGSVKTILARSAGELQYYLSEAAGLSASALENLPTSAEKHSGRIAENIPPE